MAILKKNGRGQDGAGGSMAWPMGAVVATSLAGLRFYEAWRDRQQIDTTYSFASDPQVGNEVVVQNISGTPLMVTYWELVWVKGWLWWKKEMGECYPHAGLVQVSIPPHSSHTLSFTEGDHFQWGVSSRRYGKLYLILHVAGKSRPKRLLVYDPMKF